MDTNKIKNLLEEVKKGTKTNEDATKEIMTDYGKAVNDEKSKINQVQIDLDNANAKIKTYETEIANLKESSKDNDDWKSKFEKLDAEVKKNEADAKAKAEEEMLTNNIISVFGDKKFTSDYVKNGLIADIKTEYAKSENKGKGIKDIFEELTKDKTGIFVEKETPKMKGAVPGEAGDRNDNNEISKEDFQKMGYLKRVELKQKQPELYQSLIEK